MAGLRVSEIFLSLQGESRTVGLPTVFVRLTGCLLRCHYCDTAYAFTGGTWMDLETIASLVAGYGVGYVTVTGGEPLAQLACPALLTALCDHGYQVSLETSGALPINQVDTRVSRVVDLKTPGSGEVGRNCYANISELTAQDQLKFVICNRDDYAWAKQQMQQHNLGQRCEILFSPVAEQLAPSDLADWILQDRLPVRFQLQLHKVLWGSTPGR